MDELILEAKVENLEQALSFVDGHLEAMGCPMKTQMRLDMAVEELFVNIASYAYPDGGGTAALRVVLEPEPRRVVITLTDSGVPFDPLKSPDPDTTLPAAQRRIGGLGIYMAKDCVDDMQYRREDGKNILTLRKKLDA